MSINQNSKKLTEAINQTIRENHNIETAYNKIQHKYDFQHYNSPDKPQVKFDKCQSHLWHRIQQLRKINQS